MSARSACPRCGRKLVLRRDGVFQWRACPAPRACGWDVFTHGDDPRDKRENGLEFGPRQLELIRLLATGRTMGECAELMGITPQATQLLGRKVRRKLGVVRSSYEIPSEYRRQTGIDPMEVT